VRVARQGGTVLRMDRLPDQTVRPVGPSWSPDPTSHKPCASAELAVHCLLREVISTAVRAYPSHQPADSRQRPTRPLSPARPGRQSFWSQLKSWRLSQSGDALPIWAHARCTRNRCRFSRTPWPAMGSAHSDPAALASAWSKEPRLFAASALAAPDSRQRSRLTSCRSGTVPP
jgi:hypothetical protein